MKPHLPFALAAALAVTCQPALAFDQAQKDEIGTIVRDYLVQHPEVLYEAQKEWNRRQEAKAAERRGAALSTYVQTIDKSKLHAVLGNPQGDVTLVEFFDYNCGYCRRAVKDVDAMIDADPKLRVVLIELPVIREESLGAAQVSLAVSRVAPDKFKTFHDRMLSGQSLATKTSALAVAKAVGVDSKALEAGLAKPEIEAALLESKSLADSLGVEATPTFVVGQDVVPNTTSVVDDLQGRIAAIRSCGKAVC